jgi:NNP family nitrate/nitrite transporter-like MFS transporter
VISGKRGIPHFAVSFSYFDIAFMVRVMLGPLGVQIAASLGLSAAQKGMMEAAESAVAVLLLAS